jgi:site-specific DNA recombinase
VEQFQTLSGGYTEEQEKLAVEIPAKEAAIQKLRDTVSSTDGFIAKAKRYTDITELTPELLRLFIQKIVVHEKSTKWSKKVMQTIEIHYSDIGCIGGEIPQDKESPRQEISA